MSAPKVRRSQLLLTWGPGSLIDLPDDAGIVSGLAGWKKGERIEEPRFLARLSRRLGVPGLELHAPIAAVDGPAPVGVDVYRFPEWRTTVKSHRLTGRAGTVRPLIHQQQLPSPNGRWSGTWPDGEQARNVPTVPVRFVVICERGHVDEVPWKRAAHGGTDLACGGMMWIEEGSTTGDLADLYLRCDGPCGSKPQGFVVLAHREQSQPILGPCSGRRPWLGSHASEACKTADGRPGFGRLTIRHASNVYFSLPERVISIPDTGEVLAEQVAAHWKVLQKVKDAAALENAITFNDAIASSLSGHEPAKVLEAIKAQHAGTPLGGGRPLKEVEVEAFQAATPTPADDLADYRARSIPVVPELASLKVTRVVLLERLREVVALLGFTRLDSNTLPLDSEIDLDVEPAPIDEKISWLPAVENRGEGFFFELDAGEVRAWAEAQSKKERFRSFLPGFRREDPDLQESVAVSDHLPFLMLHSLAHLLIQAVSLDCGYAAASIRERIYFGKSFGILLYTGTSDADGTLGGLVEAGRRLHRHLPAALELGRLCSGDPICAQHVPDTSPDPARALQGAACHGCLLIGEPSCERRNDMLDRSLVIPTVAYRDFAFFR